MRKPDYSPATRIQRAIKQLELVIQSRQAAYAAIPHLITARILLLRALEECK